MIQMLFELAVQLMVLVGTGVLVLLVIRLYLWVRQKRDHDGGPQEHPPAATL